MSIWKMYEVEGLAEGTLITALAVHVIRWKSEWGEPTMAFVRDEEAEEELATYRAAIASAADILRGFAMRGQEGDLQAAAEWLEKYGGLK